MGAGQSSSRRQQQLQQQQQQQQYYAGQHQQQYYPPPPQAGMRGQGQMAMHTPYYGYGNVYTQNYPPPPNLYPTGQWQQAPPNGAAAQQQRWAAHHQQQQQQQHQQQQQQQQAPAPQPPSVPDISRTTVTIRNDVNLNKSTLTLVPLGSDAQSQQHVKLRFKFDAAAACSLSVFVDAIDDTSSGAIVGTCVAKSRVDREKGLGQNFECPSAINLSKYSESRLVSVTKTPASPPPTPPAARFGTSATKTNDRYPLIIRMERRSAEAIARGDALPEPPGCALPKWVQAQTTYCILEKKSDARAAGTSGAATSSSYSVKCVKQKILVEGVSYELKEIYGLEKTIGSRVDSAQNASADASGTGSGNGDGGSGGTGDDGNAFNEDHGTMLAKKETEEGTECVICLSEPRTTTVFPCRHLCMCCDCAKMLATQTNRCPVCRSVIEGMLEIRVKEADSKASDADMTDATETAAKASAPAAVASTSSS